MKSMRDVAVVFMLLVSAGMTLSAQMLKVQNGSQQTSVSLDDLKTKPHKTITIHDPHTNADETYSGVPLIVLLQQVGAPVGHDVRGKVLAQYVVATGSDGYKTVLALAEVEPDFHPGDVIVADAMDGKPLDAKTGPFRLVVSEDKLPARSVRNLVSVELKSAE
ncbi:MAG TPA: molybdopterin-dependent oxidoreductase [Pseudacidobacterium sp.]|nr:molybdopterin-dependent oxidoreductase [Pseudacidobacterium sp.]